MVRSPAALPIPHGRATRNHDVHELAALLARGYLRLTEKARNFAIFRPGEPQKPLDLPAKPSTPCVDERPPRRRECKLAC
jgi:hypothetical protein